jgi:D-alanyl-D-alanine carboxypeptidase
MKRRPRSRSKARKQSGGPQRRSGSSRTQASAHDHLLALQRDVGNAEFAHLVRGKARAVPAQASWGFDPSSLLEDERVSPAFRQAAQTGLAAAVGAGLRPVVREAYRAPERSDELYRLYRQGKAPRAAPGWASLHNYGLAMDVYLYDAGGRLIETPRKGWYEAYKELAGYLTSQGLVWGEPINDTDHFEYHPNWNGLAGSELLERNRRWAMKTASAVDEAAQANVADWLAFFWWAAGAGGTAPETTDEAAP